MTFGSRIGRRIRRVGGTLDREIDVRIIAATSRDLQSMVNSGSFRADLSDRLNILQLETLPLRFQKDRILETFWDQLEKERATIGIELPFKVEKDALAAIQDLEWKGNYRELRNFATRLAVESIDEVEITHQCVNRLVRDRDRCSYVEMPIADENESYLTVILDPETDDLDSVYVKAAATFVEHALKRSNGNLRRAARSINTTHSTISRILKKNQERFVDTSDKVVASFGAAA